MTKAKKKPTALNFKGFEDRIALFRTGNHTDSSGTAVSISDDDLNQMASNFDAADPFPAVIGHPKQDAPAYGWAESVEVDDGVLYAKFKDVNADFAQSVESGAYRKRSISIDKNDDGQWAIRHAGWLGAAAPAIKGLPAMQFSESDTALTFSIDESKLVSAAHSTGWAMNSFGSILRGIKNWMIDKNGLDEADKLIPEYQIENLSNAGEKLHDIQDSNRGHMYSHPDEQTLITTDNHGGTSMPKPNNPTPANGQGGGTGDSAAAAAQFSQADLNAKEQDAEKRGREQAAAEFAHQQECDTLVRTWEADGKLTPGMANGLSDFMAGLDNTTAATFNFAAADGKTEPKELTPFDFAKNLFGGLANNFAHLTAGDMCNDGNAPEAQIQSNFAAPAGYSVDPESIELHNKAVQFQAKDSRLSYIDAVHKAQQEG